MDARAGNDRIAAKAEQLHFVSRVPMLCECAKPSCRSIVMISINDYRRIRENAHAFLIAPGHPIENALLREETQEYAILMSRAATATADPPNQHRPQQRP